MKAKGKKLVSLFLFFSLMMLSTNLHAKERQGAKLIITKKDGLRIPGELITVKPNSLLLLDTEGKDVSIDIEDIKTIRIVKKSKALLGAGIGSTAGTLSGIAFTEIIDAALGEEESVQFLGYFILGAIGLGVGALVGALIGAIAGKDKTIQIERITDSEIQEILDYLRKKARIREYK